MSNYLNVGECQKGGANNVGFTSCNFELDKIVGFIITDNDFKLEVKGKTAREVVSSLQESTLASAGRIYPITQIKGMPTNNTSETTFNEVGYGFLEKGKEGIPHFIFKHENTGIEHWKKLRKHNGVGKHILLIDRNGALIGEKVDDGFLYPFMVSTIDFATFVYGTNDEPNDRLVRIIFSSAKQLTDRVVAFNLALDDIAIQTELAGILDVKLESEIPTVSGVTISATIENSGENLIKKYPTEILENDVFIITKDGVTQEPVVALNGDEDKVTFTLTAGTYKIKMNKPSVLAGATIGIGSPKAGGFESNEITVVIPVA
jgi:hypothetical protein